MSDKNLSNPPDTTAKKDVPATKKSAKAGSFLTGLMAFLALLASGTGIAAGYYAWLCLLYTSPSPRDQRGSRMPSSA